MTTRIRRKAAQRKRNNKLLLWGLIALFVLSLSVVFFRWQAANSSPVYPAQISVEEAFARRDAGAFILDVREPDEWNELHVPDSTLIPLGELASRVDELPQDQEIVVVCRSGNRSAQGRDILQEAGFTRVSSMAGGLTEWRAAGYPTVSGP